MDDGEFNKMFMILHLHFAVIISFMYLITIRIFLKLFYKNTGSTVKPGFGTSILEYPVEKKHLDSRDNIVFIV